MSTVIISTGVAAETPPDATSPAIGGHHDEEGQPELYLYTAEGGALEVVVDCSACLLDVELGRWRDANGTRDEYVDADIDIDNDVVDGARLELPEELTGRALALEMHATLVNEDGTGLTDVERVVFVTMTEEADGLTTAPISWADYLIANRLARVEMRKNGEEVLNLSGVNP